MRRIILGIALASASLAASACQDGATTAPSADVPGPTRSHIPAPTGPLAQAIDDLIGQAFPRGLKTATQSRWNSVKAKLAAGDTAGARAKFADLAAFIGQKVPLMIASSDETTQQVATRLVIYMTSYVSGGPNASAPAVGGDNAFAVVTPSDALTLVTPLERAGVAFPAGAVNEPTVVIISENTQLYYEQCDGPLVTTRCQFPLFYRFDAFPHVRLNTAARFGVCHVNDGYRAPDAAQHERTRLAHDLPASPANYSGGATQVEGIEILKLVSVSDFLHCEAGLGYPLPPKAPVNSLGAALHRFDGLARAAASMLSPKSAYAAAMMIDQGVGGLGDFFSNFNVVDPGPSNVITFETYPGGQPSCSGSCDVTTEFANAGIVFSFLPYDPRWPTHATLGESGNNPENDPANHEVSQPRIATGGTYTGDLQMGFNGATGVTFEVRVNASSDPVPVTVFGVSSPATDGAIPVPATVTRTNVSYLCTGCRVTFRQETISVTYTGGISAIRLTGGPYLLLVDDVAISYPTPRF